MSEEGQLTIIDIYRGDTPKLRFNITDKDGNALDLTNAHVYCAAESDPAEDPIFNVECTIVIPATAGIAELRLTETNTGTVGSYKAEVEVRITSGQDTFVYTAGQFILNIRADVRKGDPSP